MKSPESVPIHNGGNTTRSIKDKALKVGFDCVAITDATPQKPLTQHLQDFLAKNRHGTMSWMEARHEQRSNPEILWPEVKSIIMLGMNYGPNSNPLENLTMASNGTISVYAQNIDYHDLIKKRLKQIARWMIEQHGGDVKVFVDTAPVMEKPLAEQAGLGWQGKHTNLVSRNFGSWLFLGSIFTTLSLESDHPSFDHCGQCSNCLDACPTDAFPAPYQLDARRCISYLTIEHKGMIPVEFRKAMGNRIYGCDDCLAVCPWNKFACTAQESKLHARDELKSPKLSDLLCLDDSAFRTLFSKSPIKRIGRNRFIRNVLIAAGNSKDLELIPAVANLTNDLDEIIQETAFWALAELQSSNSQQPHNLLINNDKIIKKS